MMNSNKLNLKILDCTLRDGGYYTNWDFNKNLVYKYIEAFNELPVEYLEIGYRSKPMPEYLGQYFYCPDFVVRDLASRSNKKLAIMLNEKDVSASDAKELLAPIIGLVTLVRLAVDPQKLTRAVALAKVVKSMGFEVGFNVMYMSKWQLLPDFSNQLELVNGVSDYFYMVDSYGGVYPNDVKETIDLLSDKITGKKGFHGHNNLELALINTLTAIENGVLIVDATITGMGRGAGNLKTELLLTTLNSKHDLEINFNALSSVVDAFGALQVNYMWGTNLPYMVSGANSLPQKEVMDWVGKRYFSFNSIIRALSNQSKGLRDNVELPKFDKDRQNKYSKAIIIGGGPSAVHHAEAINKFVGDIEDIVIVHASSKNAMNFQEQTIAQIFCLVGNEGHRLEKVFGPKANVEGVCVLPPYPRKMGTYIPGLMRDKAFELEEVVFTDRFKDSHTAIALQTVLSLDVQKVFLAGYDGYSGEIMDTKEHELFLENEYLFSKASENMELVSITPTVYTEVKSASIYGWI